MEKFELEKTIPNYGKDTENISEKNRQVIQNKKGEITFTSAFIDLNGGCNFKCEGCFKHMNTEQPKQRIELEQIKEIIDFAKEKHSKSIVFAGQGEPLMDKDFWQVLDYIKENELQSIIFTNATLIKDDDVAKKLLEAGPIIVKKNTLDDNLQDKLVGVKGASKLMQHGLNNLLEVKKELDKKGQKSVIGIDSYIIKDNMKDLPNLLRYCRKNGILPYFESFIELGQKDETIEKLALSQKELTELFLNLQKIDKDEFGIDTPVVSGSRVYGQPICEKGMHMFSVRVDGVVYPCVSSIGEPLGTLYDDKGTKKSLERIFEPGNEKLKKMFCGFCSKRIRTELCKN